MSKESEHGATEHFASLRWVESCKTDSAAALHHIRVLPITCHVLWRSHGLSIFVVDLRGFNMVQHLVEVPRMLVPHASAQSQLDSHRPICNWCIAHAPARKTLQDHLQQPIIPRSLTGY